MSMEYKTGRVPLRQRLPQPTLSLSGARGPARLAFRKQRAARIRHPLSRRPRRAFTDRPRPVDDAVRHVRSADRAGLLPDVGSRPAGGDPRVPRAAASGVALIPAPPRGRITTPHTCTCARCRPGQAPVGRRSCGRRHRAARARRARKIPGRARRSATRPSIAIARMSAFPCR